MTELSRRFFGLVLSTLAKALSQDPDLLLETAPIHLGFLGLRRQLSQFVDSHCVNFSPSQNVGNIRDETVFHREIDDVVLECPHRNL